MIIVVAQHDDMIHFFMLSICITIYLRVPYNTYMVHNMIHDTMTHIPSTFHNFTKNKIGKNK